MRVIGIYSYVQCSCMCFNTSWCQEEISSQNGSSKFDGVRHEIMRWCSPIFHQIKPTEGNGTKKSPSSTQRFTKLFWRLVPEWCRLFLPLQLTYVGSNFRQEKNIHGCDLRSRLGWANSWPIWPKKKKYSQRQRFRSNHEKWLLFLLLPYMHIRYNNW